MNISYAISYTMSYVEHTISYVQIQVLANRMCDIAYDVVYDIVCFLYDIVRTMYDIAKKHTISYVLYRFLPIVCATSHTTSYIFIRCRIRHRMFFQASSVLYGVVRQVPTSMVHIAKNIRYSATTS